MMIFKIHTKEKIYLGIMFAINMLFYTFFVRRLLVGLFYMFKFAGRDAILGMLVLLAYPVVFIALHFLGNLWLSGYLKGNAININREQFPDIFQILKDQSNKLGLKHIPNMYVLQGGGLLNAFAARLAGTHYVVLYSDVLEVAYQEGRSAVEFIIGHELGHIKRGHVSGLKSLLLLPARLIPFLRSAYSRACEYTCDNIGYALSPEGAEKGILILAAGKELYKKVNVNVLLAEAQNQKGLAFWFAEIFSTHPHLVNRVASLRQLQQASTLADSFVINPAKHLAQSQPLGFKEKEDAYKVLASHKDFYGSPEKANENNNQVTKS